jgi:phosphoadenosine phosphosulfate reductase
MIRYHCKNCNVDSRTSNCEFCGKRADLEECEIFWCEECNIPLYEKACPICLKAGRKSKVRYIAPDMRPVFPEERLLLEILIDKPLKFVNESVWNVTGNKYIVNGKKLNVPITDLMKKNPETVREKLAYWKEKNNSVAFDIYIARFLQANAAREQYIFEEARAWILKQAENYDAGSMFVSFSGGKDSTTVSNLVIRSLGTTKIWHIFGNTTLEFPTTVEYVQRYKQAYPPAKIPFRVAQNKEQDFFELCKSFGPPSRMLRWCCTIFKTGVIGPEIQTLFKNQTAVLTFYGIRRMESASRNNYERISVSPKITKQHVTSPIIDWSDFDVWLYLLTNKVEFNDAYRMGFSRVGCWCCPNNSIWAQYLTSIYMPDLSKRLHDTLYDFAVKMGKEDPEEYVANGGWKQRHGGAGLELSDRVGVEFKPCVTDASSFNYELNRPITEQLYELFKPFGILRFDMGNARIGEVYILDHRDQQPIMKLQGKLGSTALRITILRTPIAGHTKTIEIEFKLKCQITKYQLCMGCHACENACKYNAIQLRPINIANNEYQYTVDETKCVHCYTCIDHYPGGCYMRRVLLPRGKDYKGK